MANTLTNLIPSLYKGLDKVSREQTGFIPACRRDSDASRAAVGQAVTYPISPAANIGDTTPAMTVPEPTDQTIGNDSITISKSRVAEFGFVGEERLGLDNNGAGFSLVQADMFAQAVRGLVNEVETDLAVAAVAGASRAWGTPGTSLFASNTNDIAQIRKILVDNGAPTADLQLVLDTTAGASLRTLHNLNDDRDDSRVAFGNQGVLINRDGMAVRETGQPVAHTAGTASGATTSAAGFAVGATTIALASAGTGTILAGDVITFAGDSNQYVVVTGDSDVSNGGSIVIQEPGLRQAIPGSTTAITIVNDGGGSSAVFNYDAGGIAFYRDALVLASRAPALPSEGDMAVDRMMMTDMNSGLTFEVAVYLGYKKVRYEVALAWGVKVTQPRHSALLIR